MRTFLVSAAVVLLVVFGLMVHNAATAAAPQATSTMSTTSAFSRASSSVMHPSYRVVGSPTLSVAFLERVLHTYHSPATGTAQSLYELGVQYRIDPAVALAFFHEESSFGTQGEARSSLSLGNLRCLPHVKCQDGYAWFATWQEGYRAWYILIATLYVTHWHLTTVEQIIPVYAPSSENNVAAYIAAIQHDLDRWHHGEVQP